MRITGALINKKSGNVIAVGEWEALEEFLQQMTKLNPETFNRRKFHIDLSPSQKTLNQSDVCMYMGFGNVLNIGCGENEQ